ncbi:MAG: ATP-binding cassette domain-containing protein [Bacteroidetes bacterium]|jgi:ATP-binding cassette subfamily B protein|nr:ATP-binding cassette domain-containing protein [Bacteroidota bacterium]
MPEVTPRKVRSYARHFGEVLRMIWAAARWWTVAWAALLVVQGVLPAATVYLTKVLVDAVAEAAGAGVSPDVLRQVLWPAALMGGVLVLTQTLKSIVEWVRTGQAEHVEDYMQRLVHEHALALDIGFYETPDYYDLLKRASENASRRPLSLLENLGTFLQSCITLVAMGAMLIPYGWWLPFVLLLSVLPAFYVVYRHNQRYHDWWEDTTTDRRRLSYYDALITKPWYVHEVRLYGLGDVFKDAYQDLRRRLRGERLDLLGAQARGKAGAALLTLLVTGGVLAWMGLRVLRGTATLGDLALFYQAFNMGQGLFRGLLSNLNAIYAGLLFIEHLFAFLDLEPAVTDPDEPAPLPEPLRQGIRFQNVTFRYPGSDQPVLDGFSLDVPAGQTVALVGSNGAGKTTLTKLLCRFYDPEAGHVELDGVDLRQFSVRALQRRITVLFQFPIRFQEKASRSIAIGDLTALDDEDAIKQAARGAGAHAMIERLPRGYDTMLGRLFDRAVNLSGGQWQRLALARAFYRDAPILILDEPTSMMDSWAEHAWLNRFHELVQDRTALIITHRFTTAMRADVIHVMEEGEIIESGTHEELMARGGRYATSWRAQIDATGNGVASDASVDSMR